MKTKEELINEISRRVLMEVLFEEKKNFGSKDKKDSDMIKHIKNIIEREVKKSDIQEDDLK